MLEIWQQFKQDYLIRFWNPTAAVIAAGILSAYYFGLTGTYWAVTGEFTRWGGEILESMGVNVSDWGYYKIIGLDGTIFSRIDGLMILGMFAGCIAAALWANNIKIRMPQNRIRIVQALIGGALAGFGARLAMGCNLASLFTGIPQFSLHAWFFTLTTAIGSYAGVKFTLLPIFRPPLKLKKGAGKVEQADPMQAKRRFRFGMLIFSIWLFASLYVMQNSIKLGFAMLFGLGFGLLIERAQICFTSAFRDLWATGRAYMGKAIIYGMLISTICVFSYIQLGANPKIMWAGPNAVIGGLLFGFGIVVAGGCETGRMYRAMEGQVHFMWVGVGNVAGSTLLAYWWDSLAPVLALDYEKINLLKSFGPISGLLLNYGLMIACLVFVVWWEKRFIRKAKARLAATQRDTTA
ncbi:selenium metabolism membrane protein YedE/FdhT [Actinobacillus equuli]|uniref:selenium metabolism membrane protein YedE/FdhT n=1 Tax=Actinobacillus equuli TaxID=718 RepID=UPI002441F4C4|nr:selenium metabolism membrane protein YedE/FdhT [Actinobacillus equuli]WGE75133.1 selenium metabolism membrane protein YedE/FdhT [Actinobacillus equuli subsp. haemolyticus]WGE77047.1 selenium metabolism membrane protein YedE/FdhT [Actinobacillus equuli subsp. haemolyticus]